MASPDPSPSFTDVEVTSLGVLTVESLIIEKRDGSQYDVKQAILDAFTNTTITNPTPLLANHLVNEVPFDVSGYWPLYLSEANAQAASNVGTATPRVLNTITYYMPNLTNASSGVGVDYFLGTHVDKSLSVPIFVVNGSADASGVDHKLVSGGITIFSEDGSGWFSAFGTITALAEPLVDSAGGKRGVVSVSEELYIKYGSQYIRVTSALNALLGLSEFPAFITTGTERESLHRFSYSIDFNVEVPINIETENYAPDFKLSNQTDEAMKFFHNNVGILVTDDPSGNRVQAKFGNVVEFKAPTLKKLTVEPMSKRANDYADNWLDLSGHTFHTLIKGLFGQMLANSQTVPIELTKDTSGTVGEKFLGYITDDSLQRSVKPKKATWVESSSTLETQSFFQDEHDNMIASLQNGFRDVWSGTHADKNIDWYAALYKKSQTGPLFTNGDIFSVPVELTMRFTIDNSSEPGPDGPVAGHTNSAGADKGSLTPLTVSITNVVGSSDQIYEEKWRFIYNFKAQAAPIV